MKKVIVLLFVFGLLAVGCAGQNSVSNNTSKEPIKIGSVLGLTGKVAVYGERMKNGIDLAVKEINSSGGILGRELEVIYEDSVSDVEQAVASTKKLIDFDGVSIIVGYTMSGNVLSVAPLVEQNKVILFTPASSSEITEAGDYVFRNRESGELHGEVIAELVLKQNKTKAAVLYTAAPNGVSYKDGFVNKYRELGGEVVYNESYMKGEKDYASHLLKIKKAQPDVLYLPGYSHDIALIIKQAREKGLDYLFLSSPGFEDSKIFEIAGGTEAVEGTIYSMSYFDPASPETKEYVDSYYEAYGEESEFLSAHTYDAVKILALAIESCGGDEDTDCIRDYLYNTKDYPGVSGLTTFDENGDVVKPLQLKVARDGKFVKYEDSD